MRIKKVKWNNHPVLGDLEIDFTNTITGEPYETIVFAGENGTGKTSILQAISTFLNIGSFKYFDYIEYIVSGKKYKAIQPSDTSVVDFFDIVDEEGSTSQVRSNKHNDEQAIQRNQLDIRHYGCVYSKARVEYKTEVIKSTTTRQLDVDKYDLDKEDNYTPLMQLIVDIQNQDNSRYAILNKNLGSTPKSWNDFYPTSNIYRFKIAFDNFFENIIYDRVQDEDGEKFILFKKNDKIISIDELSTGEKQIVFRGIYLLRNRINDPAIMIDEPELSMHPKWQKKILKYYKDLFIKNAIQKAQLFFATHSEYVTEEALSNKDINLVVVLNDVSGVIQSKRIDAPSVLPSITGAETNYLAFDIVSNDYHIQLYGWLQRKESKNSVKTCDDFIKNHSIYNSSIHSKPSSHGRTTYDTLSTFIRNAIDHPEPSRTFTEIELRTSIELLIELCR